MTLTPVPKGDIATIVTSLEMLAPPAATEPVKSALKFEHWAAPVDRTRYLWLFRHIVQQALFETSDAGWKQSLHR